MLTYYESLPSLRNRTFCGLKQRKQKRGLREAFSKQGKVIELDYRNEYSRKGIKGLKERIRRILSDFLPELVYCELHGAQILCDDDINELRKDFQSTIWVNWNGDYREFQNFNQEDLNVFRQFNLQLVVAYDHAEEFSKRGINSEYWQIGWEPDGVGHNSNFLTPKHDVLFLANNISRLKDSRKQLVEIIRRSKLNFGLYGKGWPINWAKGSCLYNFKKGCKLIRASKIVIADNAWPESRSFVSNRLFQSLAAGGALVLMQYFKDFEALGFVNNKHFIIWHDVNDLMEKIRYWLIPQNDERRCKIAATGQEFCLQNHSYDVRVQELNEIVNQI